MTRIAGREALDQLDHSVLVDGVHQIESTTSAGTRLGVEIPGA